MGAFTHLAWLKFTISIESLPVEVCLHSLISTKLIYRIDVAELHSLFILTHNITRLPAWNHRQTLSHNYLSFSAAATQYVCVRSTVGNRFPLKHTINHVLRDKLYKNKVRKFEKNFVYSILVARNMRI